jgi:hypothetical protein
VITLNPDKNQVLILIHFSFYLIFQKRSKETVLNHRIGQLPKQSFQRNVYGFIQVILGTFPQGLRQLQAEIFGTDAMDQATIKDEADERMEKLESSV